MSSAPRPSGTTRPYALGAEPVVYGHGLAERVRALAPEVDVTTAALRAGGRHASIADPGELVVRVAQSFELADVAGAFRLNQEGHTARKPAIRVSSGAD